MIKNEIINWIEASGIETNTINVEMLVTLIEMKIKDAKTQSYREGYLQGKFDKEMEITYGRTQMIEVDNKLEKQYKVELCNGSMIEWDKKDDAVRGQMSKYYWSKD